MAEKRDPRARFPAAVRELCLAFPEAEEFESHGSPNYRARKGKVFAMFALNHHGDGHVALWLNTPALEQSRLIASAPKHIFKPQYVGPSRLDRRRAQSRVFLEAGDRACAHGVREQFARETRRAAREAACGGGANGEDEARARSID